MIIGTNYLNSRKYDTGSNVLRSVILAKQAVELVEKHLQRPHGGYDTMYAADTGTVKPGHFHILCGSVRIAVPITRSIWFQLHLTFTHMKSLLV